MMLLFVTLLALYVFIRTVLPLRLRWYWKALLALPLLLAAWKFHLLNLLGGPMFFAPDLPKALQLSATWMFAVLFLYFFLLLAADLVRGAVRLGFLIARRKWDGRLRTVSNLVNLGLLILALVLATVGIIGGTALPRVRQETVFLPGLPGEYEGMTVAVLADLHIDGMTGAETVREIVRRTNRLEPDLIVILGDFVDGTVPVRGSELRLLEELSAPYGVLGIPGNHEYYSGYEEWLAFLNGIGIDMLVNTHRVLPGDGVTVAGVADSNALRFGQDGPDVAKAIAGAPEGSVKILLAHQPRLAAEAARSGIDLQLSGHTHGGLIRLFDRLIAAFNDGYSAGFYRVGELQLYVNRGTRMWGGFPIRIGIPAEITLLRLHSGDGGEAG